MDRLRHFAFLITGLALVGLLATACDSGTQEPAAPASSDDTAAPQAAGDTSGRTADEIPDERLSTLPEGAVGEIPDNFPDDVAIYPGSVPAQGKGAEVEGAPISALQLMSLDPPDTVYEFYVDKLENEGWTIEDREGFAERRAITATKGNCKASVLAAPTADGGTDIFLITECSA